MTPAHDNGIVTIISHHSVGETVRRLQTVLQEKGIKIFALIDHSGEANAVGIEMHPTKMLIFGNPKAGTPLMLTAPSVAIDLPLKALIGENAEGSVTISWNSAAYLQSRHSLPADLVQKALGPIDQLMKQAAA